MNVFKKYIMSLNALFSMSFFQAKVDATVRDSVIKIDGKIFHRFSKQLIANKVRTDSWVELYFVSDEDQADIRKKKLKTEFLKGKYTEKDMTILETLIDELGEYLNRYNPLVKKFKQVRDKLNDMDNDDAKNEYYMHFSADGRPKGTHERRYNVHVVTEVGIVFDDEQPEMAHHDVVVYLRKDPQFRDDGKEDSTQIFDSENAFYDPLQYPFFHPHGEPEFHNRIPYRDDSLLNVTPRKYYQYVLQIRDDYAGSALGSIAHGSMMTHGGDLYKQYICNMAFKKELRACNQMKSSANQTKFRGATHSTLTDAFKKGNNLREHTKGTVLPSSHSHSPKNLFLLYQDAMSIVREYKKPDLFVTFTCNSNWPEIVNNIGRWDESKDRPIVVDRIFWAKCKELLKDIDQGAFGEVAAMMYTIEFQKRGLPHIHILIILKECDKLRTAEDINRFISAELPTEDYEDSDSVFIYVFFMFCILSSADRTLYLILAQSLYNISYFEENGNIKHMTFKDVGNDTEKIETKDKDLQKEQTLRDSKKKESRESGITVDHASPYINNREAVRSKIVHEPHRPEDGNTGRFDCMKNFDTEKMVCGRGFPKEFCSSTTITDDGYPNYRRCGVSDAPASATTVGTKKTKKSDNRWIVAHNKHIMSTQCY